jgi:hypothetical protein
METEKLDEKKQLCEKDLTILVKDNEGITILTVEIKYLDCQTTRKTINLMKEGNSRLLNIMLLLKKFELVNSGYAGKINLLCMSFS